MKPTNLIIMALLIPLVVPAIPTANQHDGKQVPMAKFCAGCHTPEPGLMMGFLENISYKAKTIQMNFVTHKDLVTFDKHTKIKNVESFKDILRYKNKGFKINFTAKKGGEKYAQTISRFDVLATVAAEEKLSKKDFKMLLEHPDVTVYDVRPPMLYKAAHISGAKPLPAPAFDKFKNTLPEDTGTPIVLYGPGGCLSPTTSMRIKGLGYQNVKIYTRGFGDWTQTEYTVTTPEWLKSAINNEVPHVLIDIRPEEAVNEGHITGAVAIPFDKIDEHRSKFPRQKNAPIIVYGEGKEQAATKIIAWGYRAVRVLPTSFTQWIDAGNPVQRGTASTTITYVPKLKPGAISVAEFKKAAVESSPNTVLVDVRNPEEVEKGKLEHSINIPADDVSKRLKELPRDKNIVFYCPNGVRAEMAYNTLKNLGRDSRYLDASIRIDREGKFKISEN